MMQQNERTQKRAKKKEYERLRTLVETAQDLDPRCRRLREEEREMKRREKEARAASRAAEEAKLRAEAEKAAAEAAAEEERRKNEARESKKARDQAKKALRYVCPSRLDRTMRRSRCIHLAHDLSRALRAGVK